MATLQSLADLNRSNTGAVDPANEAPVHVQKLDAQGRAIGWAQVMNENSFRSVQTQAAGKDQPVTQNIALSVTADKIECSVNGTVVGSYPKADVVTTGKLKATDGVYGLRFAHNTEVNVTNFKVEKK